MTFITNPLLTCANTAHRLWMKSIWQASLIHNLHVDSCEIGGYNARYPQTYAQLVHHAGSTGKADLHLCTAAYVLVSNHVLPRPH